MFFKFISKIKYIYNEFYIKKERYNVSLFSLIIQWILANYGNSPDEQFYPIEFGQSLSVVSTPVTSQSYVAVKSWNQNKTNINSRLGVTIYKDGSAGVDIIAFGISS